VRAHLPIAARQFDICDGDDGDDGDVDDAFRLVGAARVE
jgi:hypothetical protein